MQIELQFSSSGENLLPFGYQYELASALYRILTARAPALAKELHDGAHRSRIKLFVFSPPDILGGQLNLLSIDRLFLICIYIVRFGMFLEKERMFSNIRLLECIYFCCMKIL